MSEQSFNTLIESKKARLLLAGDHIHQPQINNLPKVYNEGTNQGYHRECYQKFTKATRILRSNENANAKCATQRSMRTGELGKTLFPDYCMVCKSNRPVVVKGKKHYHRCLITDNAYHSIRGTAGLHNDASCNTRCVKFKFK